MTNNPETANPQTSAPRDISALRMRGFVFLFCLGQLAVVQWDKPAEQVLLQVIVSCNPLLTAGAMHGVYKKQNRPMPWHGLAFQACCLTWAGIILLPYTFAAMHLYTLAQAMKRKQYVAVGIVPLIFALAFILRAGG